MIHLNGATIEALNLIPLPGLSDGSGRLAEWGAGLRPDGSWGIYFRPDSRSVRWIDDVAADGARQAVAMSHHLNARARGAL